MSPPFTSQYLYMTQADGAARATMSKRDLGEAMPDPSFDKADRLLQQMFDLWVTPDLQRRGLDPTLTPITKALVVMAPERPVKTLINEEAGLIAEVRATRALAKGEAITLADFDEIHDLRPDGIDPNTGWVCFAQIGTDIIIAFDFRRNRERATGLIGRAKEFCRAARLSQSDGLVAPALDAAYAAAELAVIAQMLLHQDDPPRGHPERRRWFKGWSELGNAPAAHSRALSELSRHRRRARYAEGTIRLGHETVDVLLTTVEAMVEHAASRTSRLSNPRSDAQPEGRSG